MRGITSILAFYLLTLAIMPCADSIEPNFGGYESISHVENESHNHSHEEEDKCPPFCLCQCCGTVMAFSPLFSIKDIETPSSISYTSLYSFNYSFNYSKGVWHPPTLS